MAEHTYNQEFRYNSHNPYHFRLEQFSGFILRDHEAEQHQGKWSRQFARQAPLIVEIGSGYGHFMQQYCQDHPQVNFVGMDYRFKRCFQLACQLQKHPSQNFRYLRAKAERLEFIFAKKEVDSIFVFFPDPWPKTRHHKKRLLQESFFKVAHQVLKDNGKVYIKTDHDDYAHFIHNNIAKSDFLELEFETHHLHQQAPEHFLCQYKTKFEKLFLAQDKNINAFVLRKKKIQ